MPIEPSYTLKLDLMEELIAHHVRTTGASAEGHF